jgi:hypothetical protein
MPKRAKTAASIRARLSATTPGAASGNGGKPGPAEEPLDRFELTAAICKEICAGHSMKEVVDSVNAEFRGRLARPLKREDPYNYLHAACMRGWLSFRPPYHLSYRETIVERYPWLRDGLRVVHTSVVEDVALHAAELVMELVRDPARRRDPDVVHVGLGGGLTMRLFAHALAGLLARPVSGLPKRICFHSLVAGFDPKDPATVPTAFFAYFLNGPPMLIETEFVGFTAPSVVYGREYADLMDREEIRDAHRRVDELDIVVATGADCPEDSTLRRRMQRSPVSSQALDERGWVGDVLWRPVAATRPIEVQTELRAMTLIGLPRLAALCAGGTQVVLLLGPCPDCRATKHRIMRAVLDQDERLISHLVVDSRTAAQLIRELPAA